MIKTLKGKISLIYICLVIMIAIIGAASVLNLYKLSKAIDGLLIHNYRSINAVSYMLEAVERQDSAILTYITIDRQKGIDLFSQNSNEFLKWYNIEFNNITEHGENEFVHSINDCYTRYVKHFSELQEILNNQGLQKSIDFYNTILTPDFIKLKKELRELSMLNEKIMFDSKSKATESTHHSIYVTLVLSAIAVSGGFFISRFFAGRFLQPLNTLTETIKLVKAGNWDQRINIATEDEIGELSVEFNNMTNRLHKYEQSNLGILMAEKNKSLAIVKSIADPLIVLDTSYRITLINDACEKFFNIKEESVLHKHFLEAIMKGELFYHISKTFEEQESNSENTVFITSMGDYYFNVIVTAVKDADSTVTGLIILLQNVTQLKQVEKVRTDFIATISHEFKTPLTSIMMGTSMLADESVGAVNCAQKDILNTIREDGERLTTLVNDLLELSRIESGKSVFKFEPCSIDSIIANSVKQFYISAEQKEVTIINETEEYLPSISADYEKITWVINNLVSNALKYTDAGDEIRINAFAQGHKMYVYVEDTGAGIPEEFHKKIFDKFVQVKGQDLEVRGTGLGLAVVKEIINAHGGDIWCESKLDSGSKFTFTLPLSE